MCSGRGWPTPEARARRNDAKRRLQEVQDLQVASVCMGIKHLMNKRRRSTKGRGRATRVSPPAGQQTRLFRDKSSDDAGDSCSGDDHQCDHDHPSLCRLCESTLRVLSTALLHVRRCRHQQKQKQHLDDAESTNKDGPRAPPAPSCDACRMWIMVGERCASLGISLPNNVLFATSGNIEGGAGVGGGRVDGSRLAGGATTAATASDPDGPELPVVGRVLYNE